MNEYEIKECAETELEYITNLLRDAGVSEKRINILGPVITNTAWMKAKLDDAREAIKNSNVVISYDNGGGQRGIRENPLFKGYEALWKSYLAGMEKILAALPAETFEEVAKAPEAPSNVLAIVRARREARV